MLARHESASSPDHRFRSARHPRLALSGPVGRRRLPGPDLSFARLFAAVGLEKPLTDTELIAKTLAGDMRALKTLMRMHHRTLYRTARAILRDDTEAEDAVQEACLRAFQALETFRGESKFSTWLVRIA